MKSFGVSKFLRTPSLMTMKRNNLRGIDDLLPVSKTTEDGKKKEEIPEQITGRGWKADDLRRKSFEDLHKLWYILGKERVRLLSEKKQEGNGMKHPERIHKVKKSMGKIKRVLHEREIVYKKAEKRLAELKPAVERELRDELLELENERNNLLELVRVKQSNGEVPFAKIESV